MQRSSREKMFLLQLQKLRFWK